jgi:glycosyltransferase involved in cell wall biosynthesis
MLVQEKGSQDARVHLCLAPPQDEKAMQRLRWIEKRTITENRSELSNTYFSLNEPAWDVSYHPIVRAADVINLHWVAGFQSPRSVARLLRLGKPVVWTLHDQRPFTGGCHFTAGCAKFETDCLCCPQLRVDDAHLIAAQLADSHQYLSSTRLALACPSQWMASAAARSRVFRNLRREVIPNSVDTNLFRPRDKPELRKALGLQADAVCVLFGADNANEKRKGFGHLLEALRFCSQSPLARNIPESVLICLGHPNSAIAETGLRAVNTGYIADEDQISKWYAAADLFVLPSLEDNLPNTVLEAMSSGLPVAAFAAGGIPDMVRDNETGKLAPTGDSAALADAILALAADEKLRSRFGGNARAVALKNHRLELQAGRYAEFYASLASRIGGPRLAGSKPNAVLSPMGPHFSEVYYGLLLSAMRDRRAHGSDHLPYRRRKFGRQRLVLGWHYLRLYHRIVNRMRRASAR